MPFSQVPTLIAMPDNRTDRPHLPQDVWLSQRWESLAREDAEFYIWTDVAKGDHFFESGVKDAARILAHAEPHLGSRGTVLEVGCGVGRVLLPMSRKFTRAIGMDIAPTMLCKLAENAAAAGRTNVTGVLADEPWERIGPVDFVYSHIVLQHIESWAIITDYFRRIRACLAPSGIFYAQLDTRRPDVLYAVKNRMPEFLLPRNLKRGVRRIRRSRGAVAAMASEAGFEIVRESGAGTVDTVFLLKAQRGGATS